MSSFAANRTSDGAQTVMVINKNLSANYTVTLNLANCNAVTTAQPWQLTASNAITRLPDVTLQTVSGTTTLQATLPAQSITLFVIPAAPRTPAVTTISGVYNTGMDSYNSPVSDGGSDPHYSLVSTPSGSGGTAVVTQQTFPIYPGFWLADTSASKWISPHANELANLEAPGDYTYQTTFTVNGDPTQINLSGRVAIDSVLKAIILNGKTVLTGPTGNINYWTSFALTSGFVTGTNTLQFIVTRTGSTVNPSGFRCELSGKVSSSGGAGTVSGLYSTGLDSSGNPLADAASEAHYTIAAKPTGSSASGTPVVTQQTFPIYPGLLAGGHICVQVDFTPRQRTRQSGSARRLHLSNHLHRQWRSYNGQHQWQVRHRQRA